MSAPADAARVELVEVTREFASHGPVVDHFNLTINSGEFVTLLGPSGCGKSTLLRLIAELDQPDQGTVRILAGDREAHSGFVFQEAHLLPWRNVLGNVILPLELLRRPKDRAREIAEKALIKVGLGDALEKFPAQLSGGMKMRVSLARALVASPRLLLLDEPYAALDENTRFKLQEDLRALWRAEHMTVVFVTHSVSEAVFLSDRAIVLSERPARILLDRKIALPNERTHSMRIDSQYLGEIEIVSAAYRSGEVHP